MGCGLQWVRLVAVARGANGIDCQYTQGPWQVMLFIHKRGVEMCEAVRTRDVVRGGWLGSLHLRLVLYPLAAL